MFRLFIITRVLICEQSNTAMGRSWVRVCQTVQNTVDVQLWRRDRGVVKERKEKRQNRSRTSFCRASLPRHRKLPGAAEPIARASPPRSPTRFPPAGAKRLLNTPAAVNEIARSAVIRASVTQTKASSEILHLCTRTLHTTHKPCAQIYIGTRCATSRARPS